MLLLKRYCTENNLRNIEQTVNCGSLWVLGLMRLSFFTLSNVVMFAFFTISIICVCRKKYIKLTESTCTET